jgi:hypothetical protein
MGKKRHLEFCSRLHILILAVKRNAVDKMPEPVEKSFKYIKTTNHQTYSK